MSATPPKPEPYPTDEGLTVLKGIDISKDAKFWSAVLKIRGDPKYGGKTQVKLYLWIKDSKGEWKRKQNFTVNPRNWKQVVQTVESLLSDNAPQPTSGTSPPTA